MEKKKKKHGFRFYIAALTFCIETILFVALIVLLAVVPFSNQYLWIPLIAFLFINALNAIFMINISGNTSFKVSWLAVTIIFPFAGLIIYWMYAEKLTSKRLRKIRFANINSESGKGLITNHETLNELENKYPEAFTISNYILKNAYGAPYSNTQVEYFKLGDYVEQPMIEALKKAKKFIFMEYFIIEYGEFFDQIYAILKEKAQEGVDVRLIYDDFGSVFKVKANFYKKANKDGIKCFCFNRCRPIIDIRQNNRDHRKIIVIDGIVAFTGGMNLADEYVNKVERFGLWKDNCVKVTGEGVNGFTNLFLSNWKMLSRDETIDHLNFSYETNKYLLTEEIKSDGYVQSFGDVPFDNEETTKNVLLMLINRVKKSIYISTPYLVPDDDIIQALINASKSGIDVRIVTPGIPDKKTCYSLTRSFYSKLLFYGVKIYEFTPGFNHTKLYVFDDDYALTGTPNLDYRSLYLHFENSIFLIKNSKVFEMKNDLLEMFGASKLISLEQYKDVNIFKKFYWGLLRIFAPLF